MTLQSSSPHPPVAVATCDLPTLRQSVLDLFCEAAYKEGEFTLSSGQTSRYYINGKLVTLHPWGGLACGRLLLAQVPAAAAAVAGLTLGADPLVTATSVVGAYEGRSLAALIVRKEAKGHGTQAYIEGPVLPSGSPVVVLEDVVTTGQSALRAVDRLRDAGYAVNHIISLVDRHQGAADLYYQEGLGFQAIFSITEIQSRWAALQRAGEG
ncbi:orotate phosphoribosyltransferase [Thermoleptolyngbya sp. C42_A2020_037]|uniref:orotate phosphoribosyltransferase n=1 Tax=Thermoleptolyngbya sp. C42_A2020_037 TaxID=2747799 RepID=UPI0019E034BE|nr:orotate phosphoribosyltransferase [Thermoleptolyngbya sp. C42_A2020_037]MBF2086026.1 orotate phosphoribosyltransferase [Thermoleptolyngbya sp. C42_A2020_037]